MSNNTLTGVSHFPEKSGRLKMASIKPGLVIAFAILIIAFLFVIMPSVFTSYSPIEEVGDHLSAPSFAHIFGTDELGRDLYARVVYGAVHSLSGALAAVLFGFVVGGFLGLVSGSIGGLVDIKSLDYIEAAYGSGATFFAVIRRHILPNAFYTVVSYAALQFGHAILQIATLGFLGYGVEPPTPEWGLIIAEGRNYIATGWWLTTIPGLVTIALVLSFNRISRLFSAKGRW